MANGNRFQSAFDYYVRSVTTAVLALGIVGAAVYQFVSGHMLSTALTGWAGLVLGVYFGQHVTLNGRRSVKIEPGANVTETTGEHV